MAGHARTVGKAMKYIIKGIEIQIDADEVWRLKRRTYDLDVRNKRYFYFRRCAQSNYKRQTVFLHREIMDTPPGMVCDHINGDTLDNRKKNLRNCTPSENCRNRHRNRNNTSGYQGVVWNKQRRKYRARITVNYKQIELGFFQSAREAGEAYIDGSKKYYKQFSRL